MRVSDEASGLGVDARLPPEKKSSKPGSLERRVVLVSREEGTGWQSPQAQGGHAVAILTKRGWQPLRSEPQASLRGY